MLPAAPVDVHSLVAQAMEFASQQMMAQFDGQMLSLAEAFEARLAQRADAALQSSLAQMAAGKELVPLEEARRQCGPSEDREARMGLRHISL